MSPPLEILPGSPQAKSNVHLRVPIKPELSRNCDYLQAPGSWDHSLHVIMGLVPNMVHRVDVHQVNEWHFLIHHFECWLTYKQQAFHIPICFPEVQGLNTMWNNTE